MFLPEIEYDLKGSANGLRRTDALTVTDIGTGTRICSNRDACFHHQDVIGAYSNTQPTAGTTISINQRHWEH